MNPPLRGDADREAVRAGLEDGTIDFVASDHAPHSVLEKDVEFDLAAFGVVGLETTLGLMLRLVAEGGLSLPRALEVLTAAPARAFGLPGGRLALGAPADLVLIAPDRPWRVEPAKLHSRSTNTPFAGWELPGRAAATLLAGRFTHRL